MLPDDPMPALISRLGALVDAEVMGERPADLRTLLDSQGVVVLSRVGGLELDSMQDAFADRPIVSADCYQLGLPEAFALAQEVRRGMRTLQARSQGGPLQTQDADEAAGVRRITCTFTYVAR